MALGYLLATQLHSVGNGAVAVMIMALDAALPSLVRLCSSLERHHNCVAHELSFMNKVISVAVVVFVVIVLFLSLFLCSCLYFSCAQEAVTGIIISNLSPPFKFGRSIFFTSFFLFLSRHSRCVSFCCVYCS